MLAIPSYGGTRGGGGSPIGNIKRVRQAYGRPRSVAQACGLRTGNVLLDEFPRPVFQKRHALCGRIINGECAGDENRYKNREDYPSPRNHATFPFLSTLNFYSDSMLHFLVSIVLFPASICRIYAPGAMSRSALCKETGPKCRLINFSAYR